jgi:hypothetical protein
MGTSAVVNRISTETLILVLLVTIMIFVRTRKTLLRIYAKMGKEKWVAIGKARLAPSCGQGCCGPLDNGK